MMTRSKLRILAVTLSGSVLLAGCGADMSDLEKWVSDKKAERVPFLNDLPEVKPYEIYTYSAEGERSPFEPTKDDQTSGPPDIGGPNLQRNREHLESFSLDSLRMVGSLDTSGINSALVQTSDGLIHRVRPGNYMGENFGLVTSISDSEIKLVEKVSNGIGGWAERDAAIGLSD